MSHLSHDALWELASVPEPALVASHAEAMAHLRGCGECASAFHEVKFARGLIAPVEPPPLSDAAATRIGQALFEAAAKQAVARPWWRWLWPFELHPGFALAAATAALLAVAAYVGTRAPSAPTQQGTAPLAQTQTSQTQPSPNLATPTPVPTPPTRFASVTTARRASEQATPVTRAQKLSEGSTVATAPGGSLWLKLPDGSRAGLTGTSTLTLQSLKEDAVSLELSAGNLVVVAKHDPKRTLSVRAGELEVVDIGTRFVVSKELRRIVVAVEEGEVQVRAPGTTTTVTAGRAVEWRDGRLLEPQGWETKDAPTLGTPAGQPTPSEPAGASVEPSSPRGNSAAPDEDEWATPEALRLKAAPSPNAAEPDTAGQTAALGAEPSAAPNAPAVATAEPLAPTPESSDDAADESFLRKVERKLNRLRSAVRQGVPPINMTPREANAREVERLADEDSCKEALALAERWLKETPAGGDDIGSKKKVLTSQVRCLRKLGKETEATRIEASLKEL